MTKDFSGCRRGFHWHSKAWYARFDGAGNCTSLDEGGGVLDEIMLGMYAYKGGTAGEFSVRWSLLCGEMSPRLQAHDDSWAALGQFADLLAEMVGLDSPNITCRDYRPSVTPTEFVEVLKRLGIEDLTSYTRPDQ